MTTPTLTETANTLRLTVPYALKDAFREIFKTARWNSSVKAFEVTPTTQNRNKWKKFLELSEHAVQELNNADELEATATELNRAVDKIRETTIELRSREEVARKQIASLSPQFEESKVKLAQLETVTRAVEDERDRLIAPVTELYKAHDLDDIINELMCGASRGYSGKARCEDAIARLSKLRKEMRKIGYQVAAMTELANTSMNRADQLLKHAEALQRKKFSGIEPHVAPN